MILTIDIGNTNIVVGCCKDDKILFIERISTNQTATVLEYAVSIKNVLELNNIKPEEIEGSIISSVVSSTLPDRHIQVVHHPTADRPHAWHL